MCFQIFLTAMNLHWYGGLRVLLGDNAGGRVAVFSPISSQLLVELILVSLLVQTGHAITQ